MSTAKKHLDYIDLAKGLCILLVVIYHIDTRELVYKNDMVNDFAMSFRLPFYFILSGLFVSFKSGYKVFLIKKINKLVVPLLFFCCMTILFAWGFTTLHTYLLPGSTENIFDSSFYNFFVLENKDGNYPNIPLWFLFSLFSTYIYFMIIDFATRSRQLLMYALSMLFGVCGFMLSQYDINLPFYLDTSMTCMPFVAFGHFIMKRTQLLQQEAKRRDMLLIVICLVITFLLMPGGVTYFTNFFHCNIIKLYTAGATGSLAMILIAKQIVRIPVVNYVGRYSIIVLCTHSFFIAIYTPILQRLTNGNTLLLKSSVFVSVLLSCIAMIYLKRYVPHLVAQKDLIKMSKKTE